MERSSTSNSSSVTGGSTLTVANQLGFSHSINDWNPGHLPYQQSSKKCEPIDTCARNRLSMNTPRQRRHLLPDSRDIRQTGGSWVQLSRNGLRDTFPIPTSSNPTPLWVLVFEYLRPYRNTMKNIVQIRPDIATTSVQTHQSTAMNSAQMRLIGIAPLHQPLLRIRISGSILLHRITSKGV